MTEADSAGDGSTIPPSDQTGDAQRAVALATEYLERIARGEEPDLEEVAGRLPEEILREQFRRLIGDARSVQELLPVQVRAGMILSRRYRVGPEIGSGGMGRVYEAYDRQLERVVALKVLAIPGASSFDAQKQFRREAVLLAGLQHRNIVAVHEIAVEGDVNYIVMDLVKGTPLNEVLAGARKIVEEAGTTAGRRPGLMREVLGAAGEAALHGPADEAAWHRAVARVVREAAHTLEAAHAAGVVHRDIKPKNVLLRKDGSPVILDFGLAGACEGGSSDMTQGLFGTTSYLAPEQASSGQVGNDPRSDVYQLGVLLHEMLSLSRAFEGSGPSEILRRISKGDCQRPREKNPSVPFELEAICLRAMELDIARRYQTARALREDLDRWLLGVELPIAARGGRLGRVLRGSRYAARRHKVAAAAAAALVLGAVIGALIWVGGGEASPGITAFRYRLTEPAAMGEKIVSVRPGDQLGVLIETPEPLYVYVLSVSGQPSPPTWVAPMSLEWAHFQARDQGEAPRYHPFLGTLQTAIVVPAGQTEVLCTLIGKYDSETPYEGLWVFTSRTPYESLEAWLDAVDAQARSSDRGAVPYESARLLFAADASGTRGGSPPRPTPQQARAISESLSAAMLLGEEDWPFHESHRWSAVWPVQPIP
jgi:hypothetical protein